MHRLPQWLNMLADDDIAFIRNFVVQSGSLKKMAQMYQVSYPTMRMRLDHLIRKIELADDTEEDSFVMLVKSMAIDERYDVETARELLEGYRKSKEEQS